MNILQVLPELKVGGVETGVVDLARFLSERDHKAIVVSNGGQLVKVLESSGAKHYQLPVHKKSFLTMIRMIEELAKIIRTERIDIVHARSRLPALIAFFACRRTGAHFITTCHGYYSQHLFSRVMGWAKYVIVPSSIIGKHMMDDFGVPYSRIRLIPRGVDLERFKFKSPQLKGKREYVIGMIGRLTPIKGHEYFIKAIVKVVRIIPNLKVWIVGDAPLHKQDYKDELKLLVHRLALDRYVEFLGRCQDIPRVLSKLDLLVLATTAEEAFGRVILEASASGVPVVATRVGGVIDVIKDGENGLLVPPKEPQLMAEAIMKILKDEKLAKSLAKKAREKAEGCFNLTQMAEKTIGVYKQAMEIKRILVIKLSAIGDVVLAVPSLRALRLKFCKAHIAVLVGIESQGLLRGCPYVDEIITCDLKGKDKGLRGLGKLARELRRGCFDIVVDLQNNRKSHMLAYLSLAPERFGYDNGKLSFLLNRKLKESPFPLSPIKHQLRTLNMLGIEAIDSKLELWPSGEDKKYVDNLLAEQWVDSGQLLVGMNLGASWRWVSKCWPLENFAELSKRLSKRNIRTVVTGSKEDIRRAEKFIRLSLSKPIIAVGQTNLLQLASLIKRCHAFVTSDSAPLHIACAVGTPVVSLFGPTSPLRHLPPTESCVVIRKDLECSPCYKPNCRHLRCMKGITVKEVQESVLSILQI